MLSHSEQDSDTLQLAAYIAPPLPPAPNDWTLRHIQWLLLLAASLAYQVSLYQHTFLSSGGRHSQ